MNSTTDQTLYDAPAALEQPAAAPASSKEPKQPKSLWSRLASPFYLVSAGPWLALAVLLVQGIIAAIIYAVSVSFIGLLLLPFIAIGFGVVERWRLAKIGHGVVANGHVDYPNANTWETLLFRLKEVATWRELGSLIVSVVWGSFAGVLVGMQVALISACAGFAWYLKGGNYLYLLLNGQDGLEIFSWGEYQYYLDNGYITAEQITRIYPQHWWIFLLAIVPALIIFAYFNGLLAASGASLSKLILSPRPEEQERQLARVTASRAKIMDAFEGERRRIERNLHDGVQQELVNLNLRLGLAELQAKNLAAETKLDTAAQLHTQLVEARSQLSHAQNTLRDTVRGIYPAVLEDHGLKAALDELARHTVIPVHLTYDAPLRLPRDLERTAYYTVNEAVTNTLKHAQAQFMSVSAFIAGDSLVVTVEDNGVGGADPARGTGLAGLMERAAALGGTVQVDSPVGGPTRLTLALPLPEGSATL